MTEGLTLSHFHFVSEVQWDNGAGTQGLEPWLMHCPPLLLLPCLPGTSSRHPPHPGYPELPPGLPSCPAHTGTLGPGGRLGWGWGRIRVEHHLFGGNAGS